MATVYKYTTKRGDRWEVRFRTPKRRVTRKRGFASEHDAQVFAAELRTTTQRRREADALTKAGVSAATVSDYLAGRADDPMRALCALQDDVATALAALSRVSAVLAAITDEEPQ
jgi:hypothetical protein